MVQEQNHLTRELSNEQTIPNVHAGKESENRWITMTNSALCLRPAVVPLMKTMLFCSFFLFSLLALAFFYRPMLLLSPTAFFPDPASPEALYSCPVPYFQLLREGFNAVYGFDI